MIKVLAVLRTLFLVFIAVFTARAVPWFIEVAQTCDEQRLRYSQSASGLFKACALAISWIVIETIIGWWMVTRKGKKNASAAPPKPAGA